MLSYLYELPFGRGKSFANRGVVGNLIGKRPVTGITFFQSGTPIPIAAADTTNLYDFSLSVGRANRLKDPVLPVSERKTERFFDTTAFLNAPPFTLPNDSVTQPRLRNYGRRNWDVALIRDQHIDERFNVQLRGDITNVFNTPALTLGTGSSVTVGTPQFGRVLAGGSPRNVQLALRVTF